MSGVSEEVLDSMSDKIDSIARHVNVLLEERRVMLAALREIATLMSAGPNASRIAEAAIAKVTGKDAV